MASAFLSKCSLRPLSSGLREISFATTAPTYAKNSPLS